MSKNKFTITIIVSVLSAMGALNRLACARPSEQSHISRRLHRSQLPHMVYLESAKNYTLCPFEIVEDVNAKRVPRVIRETVCATQAHKHRSCCGRDYSCTQLVDKVTVHRVNDFKKTFVETVSVGCVCVANRYLETISAERPAFT